MLKTKPNELLHPRLSISQEHDRKAYSPRNHITRCSRQEIHMYRKSSVHISRGDGLRSARFSRLLTFRNIRQLIQRRLRYRLVVQPVVEYTQPPLGVINDPFQVRLLVSKAHH